MREINRRELCVALSAFVALGGPVVGEAAVAQQDEVLSRQMTFAFDQMPLSKSATGESRKITHGVLPTGEFVELHETTLLPGYMPHPAHKHRHSEFMLMREGNIEFYNEGKTEHVGPGDAIFAASNVLHGWKNVGSVPAKYFVLTIGRDT
jgi:quercetin dioxygenase-like cupin family protein